MSVWQKINDYIISFGNITGFKKIFEQISNVDKLLLGSRDAAFTLALVALSAKMAGADGIVTNSEVAAFKANVKIPPNSEKQVERLFELAQSDIAGYQSYAKKIKRLFKDEPKTLEHVLDSLFYIASADGIIHEKELSYLKSVSEIFEFDEFKFEQIATSFITGESEKNPYIVLGLTPDASDDEVKKAYYSLVAEHHPDKLISRNVPKEMLSLANNRMVAINLAYKNITKTRNHDI